MSAFRCITVCPLDFTLNNRGIDHLKYGFVIYKQWFIGLFHEYTTWGRGQRKFAVLINPRARGLSKLQTSDDRGWYIHGIDRITMAHMLYAIVMMSYVLAQAWTRDVVLYWVHVNQI